MPGREGRAPVGPPLHEFQGGLTGGPNYVGDSEPLMKRADSP